MPHDAAVNDAAAASAPTGLAGGVLLRIAFSSTFQNVRAAIEQARESLAPLDLTEEELTSVEIVLAEALNNVVEHAYPEDDPGEVRLVLRHGRAGVLIEVRDRGTPMPGGKPPDGDHPSPDMDATNAAEGGFGWYLIRELARDMIYDRANGENFLVFRLAVGKRPAPLA